MAFVIGSYFNSSIPRRGAKQSNTKESTQIEGPANHTMIAVVLCTDCPLSAAIYTHVEIEDKTQRKVATASQFDANRLTVGCFC